MRLLKQHLPCLALRLRARSQRQLLHGLVRRRGGVKPGYSHGESDEFGARAAIDKTTHHDDYHATVLHLLGLDHRRLSFRYGGRDYTLTDVDGEVVRDILT